MKHNESSEKEPCVHKNLIYKEWRKEGLWFWDNWKNENRFPLYTTPKTKFWVDLGLKCEKQNFVFFRRKEKQIFL